MDLNLLAVSALRHPAIRYNPSVLMSAAGHPVILTYHSISEGDSPLKISPALFAEQMEWLWQHACVTSLNVLAEALQDELALPPRTVVLTFDDGYADFYRHAAPVLQARKLPASVFLPTYYVGQTNAWPGQPAWVKEEPLMNWQQIRELSGDWIQFEAHSWSHRDLTAHMIAKDEIQHCKWEIRDKTGREPQFFCYPYGRWNRRVCDAVREHYKAACSTVAGTVTPKSDLFVLPRVDAHYVRDPRWFRAMFTRRFEAYIAARRLVRRVRRQPEGGYPA